MRERVTLYSKDCVGRQQTQNATECIGIGLHRRCEVRGRARDLVQHVSDAEIGNDMQAAWQRVGTCQIQDGLNRIDLSRVSFSWICTMMSPQRGTERPPSSASVH